MMDSLYCYYFVAFISFLNLRSVSCLDNGLARTPPMGWLSWERFRCNINCIDDPDNCISERLYMQMADILSADGYREVGYEYVNIDDCWLEKKRDNDGRLVADRMRFPSGIASLADYVHSKQLKLGIYEDFGTKTCGGYPGSEYFLQMDAETFADWKVDMLKLDGCNSLPQQMDDAYPAMTFWLNKTGRPILYSCSWPAYQESSVPNYKRIAKYCNTWRNFDDIADSWQSVLSIIQFYGKNVGNFSQVAKPGSFNDPDMLILGNFGLSYEQERVQMAMWCIMASPLFISADLRKIRPSSKELLLNKYAISINQDPLGIQGTPVEKKGDIQIWKKRLYKTGSFAFVYLKTGDDGTPSRVSFQMSKMGASETLAYRVYEVFENKFMGLFDGREKFEAVVNPTGVFFGKAIPA